MSLAELLPLLDDLSRSDKLRLIERLASDLAREADAPVLAPDVAYPVWSPHDAHAAASALLDTLADDRGEA